MRKNKMIRGLAIIALVGVTAITGIFAYLTDSDSITNNFTVGKVDIELQEPNWDENSAKNIVPLQTIKKDPQVKNIGTNDAYVYLEVSIPVDNVKTVEEDGKLVNSLGRTDQELFTFTSNSEWKLISKKDFVSYVSQGKDERSMKYVYAYNKVLEPADTTTSLFDTVRLINVKEEEIDQSALDIVINAYAIQTDLPGIGNDNSTTSNVIENAMNAYYILCKQNELISYSFDCSKFDHSEDLSKILVSDDGITLNLDYVFNSDKSLQAGDSMDGYLLGFDIRKPIICEYSNIKTDDPNGIAFSIYSEDSDYGNETDYLIKNSSGRFSLPAGNVRISINNSQEFPNYDGFYNMSGTIRFYQE